MTAAATGRQKRIVAEAGGVNIIDLIEDPAMYAAVRSIIHTCTQALAANHSQETHEGGRGGKPSSRPPGRQHAPGIVKHVRNVVVSCAQKLEEAYEQSHVTEQEAAVIESVGGFVLAIKEGSGGKAFVARRKS